MNQKIYTFQVFGGFLINLGSLSSWFSWIQYLSVFRYALNVSGCTIIASILVMVVLFNRHYIQMNWRIVFIVIGYSIKQMIA